MYVLCIFPHDGFNGKCGHNNNNNTTSCVKKEATNCFNYSLIVMVIIATHYNKFESAILY